MRHTASAIGVSALAAALLLGACGREPTASDPGRRVDRLTACELVRRSEVAAVLEGPVGTPAESADAATDTLAGRSGCAWSRTDDSRAVLVELVRTSDMSSAVRRTGFSAAARFDAVITEHPEAEEEPSLGDRAVFVEEAATLHVLVGRSYMTLEVAATPPGAIRPAAVGLARHAVSRLAQAEQAD